MTCSYYGCERPVIPDCVGIEGMKFCKAHDDEMLELIHDGKPGPIMRFWVKANGGAKLMAEKMFTEADHEEWNGR
jgi:hypothetical protein